MGLTFFSQIIVKDTLSSHANQCLNINKKIIYKDIMIKFAGLFTSG